MVFKIGTNPERDITLVFITKSVEVRVQNFSWFLKGYYGKYQKKSILNVAKVCKKLGLEYYLSFQRTNTNLKVFSLIDEFLTIDS